MKRKNGFTLIELLAVIVILAIIALIAVPIVLNIINNSRGSAMERSVENYLTSVEQSTAKKLLKSSDVDYDGIYEISDNGKTLTNISDSTKVIKPSYNGTGIESGRITLTNGKVTGIISGKVNNNRITYFDNNISIVENKGESTLVTGEEFNRKIKTMVKGSATSAYTYIYDDITKQIYILSNGNLPEGYTKEELEQLTSINVSTDGSTIAYYDSSKNAVYVYSEKQIMANEDASYMFGGFTELTTLDTTQLDISNSTTMEGMFSENYNLTSLDLSSFDTSKVTNMARLCCSCTNLSSLNVSNFDTSKVEDMSFMFAELGIVSKSLKLDLSSFDTSRVTNMLDMFLESGLKEILVSDKWIIGDSVNTFGMFDGALTDHVTLK